MTSMEVDKPDTPLQRVFGQKKIEVFFFGPGSIEKALLRGCGGVDRNSFAQIRDSIYGRMTLTPGIPWQRATARPWSTLFSR